MCVYIQDDYHDKKNIEDQNNVKISFWSAVFPKNQTKILHKDIFQRKHQLARILEETECIT